MAVEVDTHRPGFNFDNCMRNQFLLSQVEAGKISAPKVTKTGTTICGLVYKDGVILGADTRATGGNIVANKNCEKLHNLAENIYCAGAGTAADCDKTTAIMAANLKLHSLETGRKTAHCNCVEDADAVFIPVPRCDWYISYRWRC